MIDPHDMMCQELVEVLTEYLDGTLSAHDVMRLEAHLGVCDECRDYLEQFRTTITVTRRVDAAALPAGLRDGLLRAFRTTREV
jgi:anti-sigma factor (TIGR02949 family)